MDGFARAVGSVLREARRSRQLTLRQIQDATDGRCKVSTIAGYERAERMPSLERFCELATLYGIPPEGLLARVLERRSPGARRSVLIDLTRLDQLSGESGRVFAGFVHDVRARRGDLRSNVLTIRTGDLDALAAGSGRQADAFVRELEPVLGAPAR